MDFDFNIILVPVTLFLGLIWLFDKLWFKKHQSENKPSAQLKVAQENLEAQRKLLKSALVKHEVKHDDLDSLELDGADKTTPTEIKQAYTAYREAKRNESLAKVSPDKPEEPFLTRMAYDFFPVLAIVLIVRSFIIEPFNIPSSSMVPTLYTGDFIAVNKYAYGLRLPLSYNKIIDIGQPERGDVTVFRYPENPKIYYIKRVVGLPGDTVSFLNGQLSINGSPVPSTPVDFDVDSALTDQLYPPTKDNAGNWRENPEQARARAQLEESQAQYFQEQLGEHTYLRRYLHDKNQYQDNSHFSTNLIRQSGGWQVTVPQEHYFVMGDNSDRSGDSRFWGFVPDDNLAGKAVYIWMHKKPGLNLPTFNRNGSID